MVACLLCLGGVGILKWRSRIADGNDLNKRGWGEGKGYETSISLLSNSPGEQSHIEIKTRGW